MNLLSNKALVILLFIVNCLSTQTAFAWDSIGHRLSATVASHYLDDATKTALRRILEQHPRYQQDFIEKMPSFITTANDERRFDWLLGQAAFWPDITRALPEGVREEYNRANWHYIDGAWLRGQASIQGNTYINVPAFADVIGPGAETIRREADVDNVMNALDYNTAVLADSKAPATQRAIALCWVLHLMGDIHQPLHVGSLYSTIRFANGDRGGNGIATDGGNLHARWDRALRASGVNASLETIVTLHAKTLEGMSEQDADDWSQWMQESRALLLNTVYNEEMKSAIARTDISQERLPEFTLDEEYVETMEYHAQVRLALAGRRLALWFENNL